jgi:hypothetical protein
MRRNPLVLFIISIFVNIGMWFERFVITVTSLHRDFLPSSWDYYSPDGVDMADPRSAASACSSRCSALRPLPPDRSPSPR